MSTFSTTYFIRLYVPSASIPFNKLNKYEVFSDSCLFLRVNNLDNIDSWLILFLVNTIMNMQFDVYVIAILIWALLLTLFSAFVRFYQNSLCGGNCTPWWGHLPSKTNVYCSIRGFTTSSCKLGPFYDKIRCILHTFFKIIIFSNFVDILYFKQIK